MKNEAQGTQYLELLDADPVVAMARYRALFVRLVKFFEWRGCRHSEDLAQETLRRGFSRIDRGADVYAQDPNQYFLGIARNVVKETWKDRPLQQADDALLEGGCPQWSRPTHGVETTILLRQCLASLDTTERDLILRYHLGDRDALQADLQLDSNALRVRVHRALRKVRELVELSRARK